jgi:ATP-binding protein involved in chromosome partitioning
MANQTQRANEVWAVLHTIKFPGLSRDIVSFGFVDQVAVEGGTARVDLVIVTNNPGAGEQIRAEVEQKVAELDGIDRVEVTLSVKAPPSRAESAQKATARDHSLVPEVERIIAVASGKGGVGKSTVAANLAVALARLGYRVGLLDADIYGPSVPMMFGIDEKPLVDESVQKMAPFEKFGVKVMSLGFVVDPDTPVIWRGPLVMKALEQLLGDVAWGALDVLVLDLPPGTGDAQLTLAQKVPLAGAVIVSTPQDVALIDARKGLAMFQKVNVPVLGIVENMSGFVCPHCGEETAIFKRGGAEETAARLGTKFLGRIPLDPAIALGGDDGVPIVVSDAGGPHLAAFRQIAEAVIAEADAAAARRPKLSIV